MRKILTILYTLICSLSPILVIYSFSYSSFTILDTLIVFFYVFSLPHYISSSKIKVNPFFLLMFIFVVFHSLIDYAINMISQNLLRAFHLTNYIFFLALYSRRYFDEKTAIKVVRNIAVISTFFLFFQHIVFLIIHVPIPGQLPVFLVNNEYGLSEFADANLMRFSAFFQEPSHYAMYILCALTLELFYKKELNLYVLIILCLGAVVSTSNTAIAGMFLLVVLYVRNKGVSLKAMLFLIVCLLVICVFAQTFVETISQRVDNGKSFSNRFDGYSQIDYLISGNPLWGIGFWSGKDLGNIYLPGWARLYVYFGIIGFVSYLFLYLGLFKSLKNRMILYLLIFANIGGDALFSVFFLFYSCFFVLKRDNKHQL